MSDNLKQIIKEREAYEAMATRYEKTINKHLYQPENKGMSKLDIVAKYIAELLNQPRAFTNSIADYLDSIILDTKYVSPFE